MRIPSMRIVVVALTLLGTSVTPQSAAELRVYSGGAPQETLKLLAPEFEKATGHRVAFTFAVVGAIQQRLEAGEKADVVLLPAPLIDAWRRQARSVQTAGAYWHGLQSRWSCAQTLRSRIYPRPRRCARL